MIEETEQAYEFSDSSLKPLTRKSFYTTLINTAPENPMGKEFGQLFYSVTSSDGKSYVFPSEWQDNPQPYFDAERSALYVSTALGIWRVTTDGTSKKLSSDEFDGQHYSWHNEKSYDNNAGWSSLLWITHMALSPDRRYIIYQSNRDCYGDGTDFTSVWRIDLESFDEHMILDGSSTNTINGFVTDTLVLIDKQNLLDVSTGEIRPITLPGLPNLSIVSIGHGYLVCQSYNEEDGGLASLHVFRVDPISGGLTEVITESGYFGSFVFSPSGKIAFVKYGTDPNRGYETLMLFDFAEMSTQMLDSILGEEFQKLGGVVSDASWITDNALLLNILSIVENEGVFHTWIAEW
jgi:hypothetical protein